MCTYIYTCIYINIYIHINIYKVKYIPIIVFNKFHLQNPYIYIHHGLNVYPHYGYII